MIDWGTVASGAVPTMGVAVAAWFAHRATRHQTDSADWKGFTDNLLARLDTVEDRQISVQTAVVGVTEQVANDHPSNLRDDISDIGEDIRGLRSDVRDLRGDIGEMRGEVAVERAARIALQNVVRRHHPGDF